MRGLRWRSLGQAKYGTSLARDIFKSTSGFFASKYFRETLIGLLCRRKMEQVARCVFHHPGEADTCGASKISGSRDDS